MSLLESRTVSLEPDQPCEVFSTDEHGKLTHAQCPYLDFRGHVACNHPAVVAVVDDKGKPRCESFYRLSRVGRSAFCPFAGLRMIHRVQIELVNEEGKE